MIRRILLDIEGTVSPVAFVHETMFPYARREIPVYLAKQSRTSALPQALLQMARDAGVETFCAWCPYPWGSAAAAEWVTEQAWKSMDADAKHTGLKSLQGLVWEAGFNDGTLRAPLFSDVPAALRRWREAGYDLRVYSSGSVAAQRLFFGHTDAGDLTTLFSGWYDTAIGGKRLALSYQAISADWGGDPTDGLFLSDVGEELDAADAAGWQTGLVERPGNKPTVGSTHRRIKTFDDVDGWLP